MLDGDAAAAPNRDALTASLTALGIAPNQAAALKLIQQHRDGTNDTARQLSRYVSGMLLCAVLCCAGVQAALLTPTQGLTTLMRNPCVPPVCPLPGPDLQLIFSTHQAKLQQDEDAADGEEEGEAPDAPTPLEAMMAPAEVGGWLGVHGQGQGPSAALRLWHAPWPACV